MRALSRSEIIAMQQACAAQIATLAAAGGVVICPPDVDGSKGIESSRAYRSEIRRFEHTPQPAMRPVCDPFGRYRDDDPPQIDAAALRQEARTDRDDAAEWERMALHGF